MAKALRAAAAKAQLTGFDVPPVVVAEGGDSGGAQGAAYAAWLEAGHG